MFTKRINHSMLVLVLLGLGFVLNAGTHADADVFGSSEYTFEIEFVAIGDPGNPPDTTGNPNPAGSVPYSYRIGKYAVSRDMVTKANAEGGLGVVLDPMDRVVGGPRPDMPATGIGWEAAAQFVNWLNTSTGNSPAYKFVEAPNPQHPELPPTVSFQPWEPGVPGYDPANLFRNSEAKYFLPSVDEWYKAAYYDPNDKMYYKYATGSNTVPTPVASGIEPETAVYDQPFNQGPADIMLAGGLSPHGVMGMGGNTWEWEETTVDLSNEGPESLRGRRGGDWFNGSIFLPSSHRGIGVVGFSSPNFLSLGFRVASVIPEPSTLLLMCIVLLVRLGLLRQVSRL